MRRRTLSAEERALWSRVAETAQPLHKTAGTGAEGDEGAPESPTKAARTRKTRDVRSPSPTWPTSATPKTGGASQLRLAPEPVTSLGPSTPGLDRRTAERLRRGRIAPDARIDLHGHTLERAHAECAAFIRSEHARGSRCVLIITGKGRRGRIEWGSQSEGILRGAVPRWLQLPPLAPLIVGVYPANQRHGGGGAFYVYLRRSR